MDDTARVAHSKPMATVSCPACVEGRLAPSDQIVDLGEAVRRWGEVVGTAPPRGLVTRYRRKGPCQLHECECCGLGVFLPLVPGDEEFYRFVSAANYYLDDRWDFRESLRIIGRHRPCSVLDIGCGTGRFLSHIKARFPGINTLGQDINEGVSATLEASGHQYAGCDLSALDSGTVDCVSTLQVLEHVPDPEAYLRQVVRVTKPLGLVLVSVPDCESLVGKLPDALTELPPHHVTRWNERALRALMDRCGLTVLSAIRQPLERYLWDSYIEVALATKPWFMGFVSPFIETMGGPAEVAMMVRRECETRGINCLWGIDSHTLLIEAKVASSDPGGNAKR